MAEKAIWEEDAVDLGLLTLRYVATPAAHAALRRFDSQPAAPTSSASTPSSTCKLASSAQPGEILRMWRDGDWHEVRQRAVFTIGPAATGPQYARQRLQS